MKTGFTEPSDAYGWAAVLRNTAQFFLLLALAPALSALSPVAPGCSRR